MTHTWFAPLCAIWMLGQVPPTTAEGFHVARPGYRFAFPRDHGAHPDFRTEWWYLTGHLWSATGRRFGFQLTFFRQATHRGDWKGSSTWRTDQVYLAHAALTDASQGKFLTAERLARGGLFASASAAELNLFHGPWRLQATSESAWKATLSAQGATLNLDLAPMTPPVVFGEDGVSRKGKDATATSHYVTFPRLRASGTLRLPGEAPLPVSGSAWMDHEFGSNQLSQDQVGWDWAALQFKDGRHLMAYRLRQADGGQDPWSLLSEVDAAGRLVRTTRAFAMGAEGTWTSPSTGARYPQPVVIEAWGQRWRLVPLLPHQELTTPRSTGVTYWEGACRVLDEKGVEVGDAYLEQTGYAHSLKGRF